ncbi:MAG: hypothetical protein HY655_08905 [Acidobacteria bacterium]|nr:hypothetical protein [Acidobacteriota bacterium]
MESVTTESATTHDEPAPIAPTPDRSVDVDATTAHIRALSTDRPSIVAYLRTIPESKREIALLHALEVGITELAARRERFKH